MSADHRAQPEQEISASEALYAFAAWLTCMDSSITFGSRHVATQAADLVQAFSQSQGLADPRENWSDLLKPYPGAPAAQPEQAAQAQPQAGQEDCGNTPYDEGPFELGSPLESAAAPSPAAPVVPQGWKLVPVVPTHAQAKAAADAWLDCGSKLMLNKALAAVRAGIAAAPSQADQPADQEAGRVGLTDEQIVSEFRRLQREDAEWCAPCDLHGLTAGVRFAEKHHGIPAAKAEGER